jgi:phosphoglycolate phosphatase
MAVKAEVNQLKDGDKKGLVDSVETFIFDCDGVIWKGDSLIEGVPETIAMLREMGKRLIFVTNNSTKSRAGYLKKFLGLGLEITAEEVFSSSFAAAAYLESVNFPKDKKVYVVGEVGILEELDGVGIQYRGGWRQEGDPLPRSAHGARPGRRRSRRRLRSQRQLLQDPVRHAVHPREPGVPIHSDQHRCGDPPD